MLFTTMSYLPRQAGLSFTGMMIALLIGLFLIGGVTQVYVAHVHTFGFVDAYSRTQESGRFAMDMVAQDLRVSGFWGCASFDPSDTPTVTNHLDTSSEDYVEAIHDYIGQGGLGGTESSGLNGSDSLIVRGVMRRDAGVQSPYSATTWGSVYVSNTGAVAAGDIVMVSNCEGGDIFQVTAFGAGSTSDVLELTHLTGGSPGNVNSGACGAGGLGHCLSRTYGADAIVSALQTVEYSIATGASGEPALWRSENGVAEEIIDGIAEMQIVYGIDTDDDGSVNRYLDSTAVPDMNEVNVVRISLLIESANDGVVETPQAYSFNGDDITPTDRRLRQVFTTTIGLRNRGADRI